MLPVVIRKAGEADANAVLEVLRTAFEPYRGRYTPEAFADTVMNGDTIRRRFSEMTVLVAVNQQDEIVGTIGYGVTGDEGHLRGMAVSPGQLGAGVAPCLLASAERALRQRGCTKITLDTTQPLERAIRFYARHGFHRSGVVRDFFGMRLVEFEKRIPPAALLARLDHLVYATPDLERSVGELEQLLGVRAAPGGQHRGRGTRNALIALSPTSYLEIIAPDPAQDPPPAPRWFGIDTLTAPRLATWAAKASDLELLSQRAAASGVRLGAVGHGSRTRTDGRQLAWQFIDPVAVVADGVVPFFIDWGASAHPAESAPGGPTLLDLQAEHPAASDVQRVLSVLEIDLPVYEGRSARLIAMLDTKRGEVCLE